MTVCEPDRQAVDAFVAACRDAAARGLVRCSSGNLSARLDAGRMLITASRSWMDRLTAEQACVCRIADGAALHPGDRPSVEVGFHAGVLAARPDAGVVLHFQSPCATALACRNGAETDFFLLPEIPFYIGPVARVPYLPPGSRELAAAVTAVLADHDMAVLANHGQVTVAADYARAIQNAAFFELACEILVANGGRSTSLPDGEIARLLALKRDAGGTV